MLVWPHPKGDVAEGIVSGIIQSCAALSTVAFSPWLMMGLERYRQSLVSPQMYAKSTGWHLQVFLVPSNVSEGVPTLLSVKRKSYKYLDLTCQCGRKMMVAVFLKMTFVAEYLYSDLRDTLRTVRKATFAECKRLSSSGLHARWEVVGQSTLGHISISPKAPAVCTKEHFDPLVQVI